MERVFRSTLKPIRFFKCPGENANDVWETLKKHMGFGAASAVKMNVDIFSATFTLVLINFRLATKLVEIGFVKERFNEVGASCRALAELAMTVDNVFGLAGHMKLQSTA